MSINDEHISSIEKIMQEFIEEIRPPEEIRAQLDMGYKIEAQSVFIFEIRPQWNDPTIIREYPLAKATFVKTQNIWKIFWKRADGSWHGYTPAPEVKTLQEFTEVVREDKHHCFWG